MTSCVRILSTSTIDSSPSILIISNGNNNTNGSKKQAGKKNMNNSKILINCGEGCQRTFVEYSQRLSTVTTVCICSLHNSSNHNTDMIGGLPGAILTISDTATTANSTQPSAVMNDMKKNNPNTKQKPLPPSLPSTPPFQIIGPMGIKSYISSLRHFMRRDTFQYTIDEVMTQTPNDYIHKVSSSTTTKSEVPPSSQPDHSQNVKNRTKKETATTKNDSDENTFGFTIQTIAFSDQDDDDDDDVVLLASHSIQPLHPVTRKRSLEDALILDNDDDSQNINSTSAVVTNTTTPVADNNSYNTHQFSSKLESSNTIGGCVSFILRTPPIPGKFMIEKATALGIPKGPLFRLLKMGQDVSFLDAASNEIKYIKSSDVVEPSTPPIIVMILYYPTKSVAKQLFSYIKSCMDEDYNRTETPELVIHLTSSSLFHQYGLSKWEQYQIIANGTAKKADHIFLPINDLKYLDNIDIENNVSPFRSAMLGAYARSLLHPDIYVCPNNQLQQTTISAMDSTLSEPAIASNNHKYYIGQPTMEYTILPRSKRGFVPVTDASNADNAVQTPIIANEEAMEQLVASTGASTLAQQIINEHRSNDATKVHRCGGDGELVFTGTASALPCKHRNVTGMLLKQSDKRSIILDIGEGTIGQLLRMRSSCTDKQQQRRHLYKEVKAVWISHPHADHHLGLTRLLKDRRQFETDKLLIIAPTPIFRFLDEISVNDPEISGAYITIDCKDLVGESPEFLPHQQTVQDILGITRCRAVPVAHCAHAYAVILDGTSFGTVVYSGDCRPSTQLAIIAKGADVLIHESTFESDMQADAVLKKHSTIDEALNVGRQMECKYIILTHFSQRYSKVPPLPSKDNDHYPFPIIYAYDFMRLQPHTLFIASKLTPALRLLFAEDTEESVNGEAAGVNPIESLKGVDVLSIPGAFANASLL